MSRNKVELEMEGVVVVAETVEEEGADEGEIQIQNRCLRPLRNRCRGRSLHISDKWLCRVQRQLLGGPQTFPQDPRLRKRSLLDHDQQRTRLL